MEIVDLTLELYDGLQTYAAHPPISIAAQSTFENSKDRYSYPAEGFESRMLSLSDHSGTHVDAPIHFIKGGETAADMEVERLIGPAYLLDLSESKEPQEPVTRELLDEAERHQDLTSGKGDIVLVRTRKGTWGDNSFFEEKAFAKSGGEWLSQRELAGVGIDFPNLDINENMKREAHMEVLGKNIYVIENLVNLDQLPKDRAFIFLGLPLKLRGGTASPIRAVALLNAEIGQGGSLSQTR